MKTHTVNRKPKYFRSFILSLLFIACGYSLSAQQTIWGEDFSGYNAYSGIGTGQSPYNTINNMGDYPDGITKWSLDVSQCYFNDYIDYVRLNNDGRMNFSCLEGTAIWLSEEINITGYSNVGISIELLEEGVMSDNDYVRCFYQIDGGALTEFAYKINDFSSAVAKANALSGEKLKIYVYVQNYGNRDNYRYHMIDNIFVTGDSSNSVRLSSSSLSIPEGGGSATITATLQTTQPIDIEVLLDLDGQAQAGMDYTLTPNRIVIPAGNLSAATILLSVNDTEIEGSEGIQISIQSVSGGLVGGGSPLSISIIDDDSASTESIKIFDHSDDPNGGTFSPEKLVQDVLITGCLTASNIKYQGKPNIALGYFEKKDSDFPISSGIVMSTGYVKTTEGPNKSRTVVTDWLNSKPSSKDKDVLKLTGELPNDSQILEFDFVPAGNKLKFRYVFASREYPTHACSQYNDVFAFILSGPGIQADEGLTGKNIALLPGPAPQKVVSINTVNDKRCGDENFYIDTRHTSATSLTGQTVVLTASADVEPCKPYHIRLIISDVNDELWNSAVFLEAKSFKTNEVVVKNGLGGNDDLDIMYEGCNNSFLKFTREDNLDEDFTFNITLSGSAVNGVDYVETNASGAELGRFPTQITIPANETEVTHYYKAVSDSSIEGDEEFTISFLKNCPCSSTPEYYRKNVKIIDVPEIEASIPSNVKCMNGNPVATIKVDMKSGLNPLNYIYSIDGLNYQESNIFTINNAVVGSSYTLYVQDKFSCNPAAHFSVTIPEVSEIKADAGGNKTICEGESLQLSGSGGIFYEWTCNPTHGLQYLSDVNISNPIVSEHIPHGTYEFTLTARENDLGNAKCVSSDMMTLTVKESPRFSISSSKSEYCSGEEIHLASVIINSDPNDHYVWSPTDVDTPNLANTTATYVEFALTVKEFSLEITKQNGCRKTQSVTGVILNPHPEITLLGDSNRCVMGANGNLMLNVSGGTPFSGNAYNYLWSHDGTLNSPDATNLSGGNYTVTVTDSKSCTQQENFDVNTQPMPKAISYE